MDMSRRDAMACLGAVAAVLTGAASVRAADGSQVLVVTIGAKMSSDAARAVLVSLESIGVKAIVVCDEAAEVAVVDAERTFFSANRGDHGECKANGRPVKAVWCETSHGLYAVRDGGGMLVQKARCVEFIPANTKS